MSSEMVEQRPRRKTKWNRATEIVCVQCDNQKKNIILYMSHFAIDWMFKCDYFPPHFLFFIYDLVRAAMHVNGFWCVRNTWGVCEYMAHIYCTVVCILFHFYLPRTSSSLHFQFVYFLSFFFFIHFFLLSLAQFSLIQTWFTESSVHVTTQR